MELDGKVALVTGAAHRIGQTIAEGLAKRGCALVVHYNRSRDSALRNAAILRELDVQVISVQADLTQHANIEKMFIEVDQHFGGLDVLVNSAAVMHPVEFLSVTESDWSETMDLNLKAAFFCIQQAAVRMRARGGGAVVNISDVAGLRPWKAYPLHSISKAGVEMLTQAAARALAPDIRVNAVTPGFILKTAGMGQEKWDSLSKALPLGRDGSPVDVVASVLFLLENDYLTGETLVVDGGMSLV